MYSAILMAITFVLFGINLGGFYGISTVLLGVLFIVTGIVIFAEHASTFRR